MKIKKILIKAKERVAKNKRVFILLTLLFIFFLFFRFYELESRAQFTWDQVDNAWTAKNMIVNGEYPLTGMPAKGNESVTIGPYYYYFVAFFYLLTNLDPIASPIVAGVVSIFSFGVLFYCVRKLFNDYVALIAVFINTFSNYLITMDRVQWPVELIPPVSLLIFLSVVQIIKGKTKYILLVAFLLGASLHIHFTSIFYIPILFLALPLFPRKKTTLLYIAYSIPLFLIWTIPFILSLSQKGSSLNIVTFIKENNIGFHLRRVIQVSDVAFLEGKLLLGDIFPSFVKFLPFPLFAAVFLYKERFKKNYFLYLITLWFIVPWFGLSMYGGELTPYYFSINRFITILILSYVLYELLRIRKLVFAPLVSIFAVAFLITNIYTFAIYRVDGMDEIRKDTYKDFQESKGNEFLYGSGKTYFYYFYEYRAYGKK